MEVKGEVKLKWKLKWKLKGKLIHFAQGSYKGQYQYMCKNYRPACLQA